MPYQLRLFMLGMAMMFLLSVQFRRPWRFLLKRPYCAFALLTGDGIVLGWTHHPTTATTIPWNDAIVAGSGDRPRKRIVLRIREHLTDLSNVIKGVEVERGLMDRIQANALGAAGHSDARDVSDAGTAGSARHDGR